MPVPRMPRSIKFFALRCAPVIFSILVLSMNSSLYGLHRKEVTFVQGTGPEDRYSLGLLTYGPYSGTPFDAEAELTAQ